MAFSKQPVNSTYQTKPVTLLRELDSRGSDASKDAISFNAYVELVMNKTTSQKEARLVKRDGTIAFIASAGSGGVRGAWLWKDQQKLYLAIGSSVYVYNSDTGGAITTLAAVYGTTTGDVGFEEFNYSTNTVKVLTTDGTTLSTIDSANTVVACVDADLPVHRPQLVVIDGYVFVLKINSADIYNSDNDDPLAWPNDFISAEMRPDLAVRIAPLNNYLVCFGTKSIEYFYDNANETGSPLSRNDSAIKSIGYVGGFAQYGSKIFIVGETSESIADVFTLSEFKAEPSNSQALRRHLASVVTTTSLIGTVISMNGHDFYCLTTDSATYVMELESMLWDKWGLAATTTFPCKFSFANFGATGYKSLLIFTADQSVKKIGGSQDEGVSFPTYFITGLDDFDSYNNKIAHAVTLWGDKPVSSLPVLVQTSDDDYQSWTTGQTIDMFQELPSGYRFGRFRRRAHRLSYTGALAWRLEKIELDLNLGQR